MSLSRRATIRHLRIPVVSILRSALSPMLSPRGTSFVSSMKVNEHNGPIRLVYKDAVNLKLDAQRGYSAYQRDIHLFTVRHCLIERFESDLLKGGPVCYCSKSSRNRRNIQKQLICVRSGPPYSDSTPSDILEIACTRIFEF